MTGTLVVLRKELRTYFQSPVALLFLGVFLVATLFTFFTTSAFFARNIADVRPLFEWLPLLLVFLVSAITMRQWAEEQKMGTLEVLLTLPVRTSDLVLGKFLAGLSLVGLALALTLPIPLMVWRLGELDWGPVIGGYVGALCLSAAYLALGLCVSARTDNQVVALMVTLVLGGAMYVIGSDSVTALFGTDTGEILRGLGTGSRFHSIERGVLDARDLAYYGSIAAFFLVLNGYFLEVRRIDTDSTAGGARHRDLLVLVALVGANAAVLPVWLAPVTALRVDLTANGDYSVSSVTTDVLARLDEPLVIQGVFSERTHPLLAPLIPQIEDMLEEYAIRGKGRVTVQIVDPTTDEALEQEMNESYGIRSVPFRVQDTHQQAVVNSYFAIVVKYGDKFETLSFQDLIEVRQDEAGVDVRLRSLEYDLTRVIKKVSSSFQSLPGMLQKLPEGSRMELVASPETIPENDRALVDLVRNVGGDLVTKSAGRLTFADIDPSKDPAVQEQLAKELGIRPFAADLFATQRFWLSVVLRAGDRVELVPLRSDMGQADFEKAVEAAVKRVTPGQLRGVALLSETPKAPPPNPRMPAPPPPEPDYKVVEQILGDTASVQRVELTDGRVPDDAQTLLVAKPGALTDQQKFAIDQFLMRGGSLVVLAGRYQIGIGQEGLEAKHADAGLFEMLEGYGVRVSDSLVMDPQNAPFPIPVSERRGAYVVRRIQMLPYPFFADIRADGFDRASPVLSGIDALTTPWASPVEITADPTMATGTVILRTSEGSWVNTDGDINPDFQKHPEGGFAKGSDLARRSVGVLLVGKFKSAFAEKEAPHEEGQPEPRKLTESPSEARLAVIGSSELTSDLMLQVAQQSGGEMHRGDLQLLQNLIDWSVEDSDLLQIRSSGAFARTLQPMEDSERTRWTMLNAAVVLGALLAVAMLPRWRRQQVRAITVPTLQEGA